MIVSARTITLLSILAVSMCNGTAAAQFGIPDVKLPFKDKSGGEKSAALAWPVGLLIPKPDEGDYASMKQYSAPVIGKVCYMVDRVDSLASAKTKLAVDAASFLFELRATDQERAQLKTLDDELAKESNPLEKDRKTAARLSFIETTAVASSVQVKLDEQQKALLAKQAENAAVASKLSEQQAVGVGYGLALAASEVGAAKEQLRSDPLKAKAIVEDAKKLQDKLEKNKKENEQSKEAIEKLDLAMRDLCKANAVSEPSQANVDANVKAAATEKLTPKDE